MDVVNSFANTYNKFNKKRTKFSLKDVLFLREELLIEKKNTLGSTICEIQKE